MARGTEIVVTSPPRGVFDEGTIDDTSKPGTLMQIEHAKAFVGGRPWFIAANVGADGGVGGAAILCPDRLQGKLSTDAYVSGTRCFIYWPVVGEEYNMLVGEGAGTSNTITQGDLLMCDSDTGILIPISSNPAGPIFQAMETLTQVAGSTLCWVKLMNL